MEEKKSIFRSYDIRGIVGNEIDESFANTLGKGFASYIKKLGYKEMIVGHDCRDSSDGLNEALIKGVISTGINVIDIGLSTTPMVYYARKILNIGPAIQITASHNPSEYNGFKMCIEADKESIFGDRIMDLYNFICKDSFEKGEGIVTANSINDRYMNEICNKIKLGNRKLKVVLDCANATPCIINPQVLEKLGIEIVPLYCELDSSFPNHHPDPSVGKNLKDLADKVIETGSDFGVGFDGDGDRIGFVDEMGNVILGDDFMIIMWREIIKKYPESAALVEVKCSQKLWDELEVLGAKPEFIRTGNPYIKSAMKEKNIPFAGEMSGHIFFSDEYYGFDDALYAAARFARLVSNTDKKVSQLLDGTNEYISTEEIGIKVEETEKFQKLEKAVDYFKNKNYEVVTVDGARVVFEDGWGLIRASNTTPKFTLRYEAKTQDVLNKIEEEFNIMLNNI